MDKTPLDDFLVPIIGYDDLEPEAHCYLEEYYAGAFYHPGAVNLSALAKENGLNIRVAGLSPDGNGKKAQLYLFEKQETLYDENGNELSVKIPENTILEMSIESLEVFENIAWTMAKHADPQNVPDNPDEWLEAFNTFSIYEVLPQLIELWGLNVETQAESKKIVSVK